MFAYVVNFSMAFIIRWVMTTLKEHQNFAKHFEKADLVVSVAKLKSHQLMSYTGAMKNLFGLIVGLKKAQQHYRFPDKEDFAKYLTDLNLAAKAEYAIMDGIVGMDGPGGPGNGRPIPVGFLASSTNILAISLVSPCKSNLGRLSLFSIFIILFYNFFICWYRMLSTYFSN